MLSSNAARSKSPVRGAEAGREFQQALTAFQHRLSQEVDYLDSLINFSFNHKNWQENLHMPFGRPSAPPKPPNCTELVSPGVEIRNLGSAIRSSRSGRQRNTSGKCSPVQSGCEDSRELQAIREDDTPFDPNSDGSSESPASLSPRLLKDLDESTGPNDITGSQLSSSWMQDPTSNLESDSGPIIGSNSLRPRFTGVESVISSFRSGSAGAASFRSEASSAILTFEDRQHQVLALQQAVQSEASSAGLRLPGSKFSSNSGSEGNSQRPTPSKVRHSMMSQTSQATSGILHTEDKQAYDQAKRVSQSEMLKEMSQTEKKPKPVSRIRRFVEGGPFEIAMTGVVLANALAIGFDVQMSAINNDGNQTSVKSFMLQHTFTTVFFVEFMLRLKAFGIIMLVKGSNVLWAWFDLFIVVTSVIELIFDVFFLTGSDGTSGTNFSQFRVARVIKVTRLVRTFRISKIIRFVAPLRTLIFSIAVTLKSLMWALMLLSLICYVVGVVIVQMVTSYRLDEEIDGDLLQDLMLYWPSLDTAMFTMLQSISGGVSWREPAVVLGEVSPMILILFTGFVCFVYFAVLNVVTGVFCSSAIETAQRNPEVIASAMMNNKHVYQKNLRHFFSRIDSDGSGVITLVELEKLLSDEMMRAHLVALEIDVQDAWELFRLIDTDKSGSIELDEFIEGCERLKGTAKGIDMASLRTELKCLSRLLVRFMKSCEEQLESLSGKPPRHSTRRFGATQMQLAYKDGGASADI